MQHIHDAKAKQFSSITKAPLAFAFDIDGVLIRGPDVIPGAQRALNKNTSEPCLQLTNGGGEFEHVKSEKLSKQLGVHIEPEQMIQSHTIMRQLAHKYASKPVLVLGGKHDMGRRIANSYGFQDVYIPVDFLAWEPSIWPLGAEFISDADLAHARRADFRKVPFAAVFVIHDPRPSWFLEIQPPPELVFCNPDLVWRGQFHRVRLGQGAFRDAFQAVYTALEGAPYPYTQYGKPTKDTYDFAHDTLARLVKRAGGQPSTTQYYMIGDNPESDIAGANAAGWHSVLVHTGVYDHTRGPPTHMPTEFADNVEAAVALAFERECGVKL
ncbi:HAD-superfamily hydrolase [Exidia glandulosa HHB12029]|uniref:HAD-superfamily hydrolase n=1 Tax=Exidia glandulosa HHB12029 TaxID=1314781 RepID=A0A165KG72_EXIGL|nr:HAD-superfamily hydrolase [Exidia glandulosa HHB12029]